MIELDATWWCQSRNTYSAGSDYLEVAEEGSGKVSWMLRKDDFVCTNLMFAVLDDDIRVLRIVEEWSRETIYRRHDEAPKSRVCGQLKR
jgi:hypothetical protein